MAVVYTNFFGGSFFGGGFFGPGTDTGGVAGLAGGGSKTEEWKIPQWAVEQREERERTYEEEQARKRIIESAKVMAGASAVPEVRIPEGGIVAHLAYEGAEKLAQSIESVYGIAGIPVKQQDENESAIIAILLSE